MNILFYNIPPSCPGWLWFLEKSRDMMANLRCQLNWAVGCPGTWLNIISDCLCGGVSKWDQHLNLDESKADCPLPMWVGLIQSVEGLSRTKKKQGKEEFALHLTGGLKCPFSAFGWDLYHQLSWVPTLQTADRETAPRITGASSL